MQVPIPNYPYWTEEVKKMANYLDRLLPLWASSRDKCLARDESGPPRIKARLGWWSSSLLGRPPWWEWPCQPEVCGSWPLWDGGSGTMAKLRTKSSQLLVPIWPTAVMMCLDSSFLVLFKVTKIERARQFFSCLSHFETIVNSLPWFYDWGLLNDHLEIFPPVIKLTWQKNAQNAKVQKKKIRQIEFSLFCFLTNWIVMLWAGGKWTRFAYFIQLSTVE